MITDNKRVNNIAAEYAVEKYDPDGHTREIRLRLFIATIDRARAPEAPRGGLEFVPFAGLRREERYAKVPGHELAHVANMVRKPNYMAVILEICREQLAIAVGTDAEGRPLPEAVLKRRWERI